MLIKKLNIVLAHIHTRTLKKFLKSLFILFVFVQSWIVAKNQAKKKQIARNITKEDMQLKELLTELLQILESGHGKLYCNGKMEAQTLTSHSVVELFYPNTLF